MVGLQGSHVCSAVTSASNVSVFGGVVYNDVYKGAITALYTLIYIRRVYGIFAMAYHEM
jgi:hypothetical protein